MQPVGKRILVRVGEALAQSEGGIFFPDTAQKGDNKGIIEAIALESKFKEEVIGRAIIMHKNAKAMGTKVGEDLYIIDDDNVIAYE